MSKIRNIFGIECDGKTSIPMYAKVAYEKYGVPVDMSASDVLADMTSLTFYATKHEKSDPLDGADLAFAIVDYLRGEKEPEQIETEGGLQVIKPVLFRPGGSAFRGFTYAIEKFVSKVEEIDISYPLIADLSVNPSSVEDGSEILSSTTNSGEKRRILTLGNLGVKKIFESQTVLDRAYPFKVTDEHFGLTFYSDAEVGVQKSPVLQY